MKTQKYRCENRRFDTLAAACDYANLIFRRTGNIVAVTAYTPRKKLLK